jgi:hypothetical protein
VSIEPFMIFKHIFQLQHGGEELKIVCHTKAIYMPFSKFREKLLFLYNFVLFKYCIELN